MNLTDKERLARLTAVFDRGYRVARLYADYLERYPEAISEELVRELLGERVFVLVNLREYFTREEAELFFQSALSHQFCILLLESRCHPRFAEEERLVIDGDLCEF